ASRPSRARAVLASAPGRHRTDSYSLIWRCPDPNGAFDSTEGTVNICAAGRATGAHCRSRWVLLPPSVGGMSMLKRVAVATLAVILTVGLAVAEPAIFTWTGYRLIVPGSGKSPIYKMTIDVTVVGTDVQGRFQQEGRPERIFKASLGACMKFKTTGIVGGGNKMDVVGSLKEGASTIMLDGYCLFEGKLTKR